MKTQIALSLMLLVGFAQLSQAATSISLEANDMLSIADAQGMEVATLNSGSISEKISADNQAFKISFGQDLQGRHTIIIYPDPESPQSLDLNILGQSVQMTQDSVLTISASDNGGSALFQAGVLGEVTLAGSPISPGSSLSVQNGQMIATTPTELLNDDAAEAAMKREELATALGNQPAVRSYNGSVDTYNKGMVVRKVTGTVMMAPPGQDVLDILRNSSETPKLKEGDVIPHGSSVRTDFGGELVVAQSPGVTFQILPNSNVEFTENEYKLENGIEKRTFKATLDKGGIISNLENVDPNYTDYQIKTPLAVAAARGTAFAVYTSSSITVVVTADGTVTVTGQDGAVYTATIGEKAIVTFDPSTADPNDTKTAEFEANSSEMQAVQNLIAIARQLNNASNNPTTSGTQSQQDLQDSLDAAVENFQSVVNPTLNPGAITPTTSP
ncbi:MAG: FecR domain-containing protein [Verrucomicrobiota bacterium]